MNLKLNTFLIVFFCAFWGIGQTFSGKVLDAKSSERIPAAQLHFFEFGIQILTDSIGEWQVSGLPAGMKSIVVSAIGYNTVEIKIDLNEDNLTTFYLEPLHRDLDKVIINHNGILQKESVTNVESFSMQEISLIPSTSLGESISQIPGVSQAGIGTGIAKPVIRGLSGSSIVTYVNGLRIQNQQWGGDHGLPIGAAGIGRVEVIKGPSSLLYGVDALGGVLYFRDEAFAVQNTYELTFKSKYEHNALGSSNEMGFKWSRNKLKMNFFAGYDNFSDYRIPGQIQVLNSRFRQASFKGVIGYNYKNWVSNFRYNFFNARIGLPGHTHDLNPDLESFLTLNRNRTNNAPAQLINNHFISWENTFFYSKSTVHMNLGQTFNGLEEFEEKIYTPDIILDLSNTLFNLRWKRKIKNNWQFLLGGQSMFQQNRNGAKAVEILIPDANTLDVGLYGLLLTTFKKWNFQIGGRLDKRILETNTGFTGRYNGYNFSTGLVRAANKSTIRFNVASGYRPPNTSELLSNGVHHGAFRYEIGNANLVSEKAIQTDFSAAFHFNDFEIIVNPYFNLMYDFIILNRVDSIIDDYNVFEYRQTDFAMLYGLEAAFHFHPHSAHWLHLESNITSVFGEDENKNPLAFMPQTRLRSTLKVELKTKGKFSFSSMVLQHNYFFKQNRISMLETENPAFHVWNFAINLALNTKNPIDFSFGIKNLLNRNYIDHLSGIKYLGIPNPGINFYGTIQFKLNNNLKNK